MQCTAAAWKWAALTALLLLGVAVGGTFPSWSLFPHLSRRVFFIALGVATPLSVVGHEFGHALAARRLRHRLSYALLDAPAVVIGDGGTYTAKDMAIIASCGPAANAALAIAAGGALLVVTHGPAHVAVALTALLNVVAVLVNVLPILRHGKNGALGRSDGRWVLDAWRSAATGLPIPPTA